MRETASRNRHDIECFFINSRGATADATFEVVESSAPEPNKSMLAAIVRSELIGVLASKTPEIQQTAA
jgi:hypothetical protein